MIYTHGLHPLPEPTVYTDLACCHRIVYTDSLVRFLHCFTIIYAGRLGHRQRRPLCLCQSPGHQLREGVPAPRVVYTGSCDRCLRCHLTFSQPVLPGSLSRWLPILSTPAPLRGCVPPSLSILNTPPKQLLHGFPQALSTLDTLNTATGSEGGAAQPWLLPARTQNTVSLPPTPRL